MMKLPKDISIFQLLDRRIFTALVDKWEVDKGVRQLTTWEMTCALVSCMMMRLSTYREVEVTLGIPRATLGDALTNRCPGFFEDLCDQILLSIKVETKDRKLKRAVREVLALDSTEIQVHGSLFKNENWSKKPGPFKVQQRAACAKLHVIWNVDGAWVEDYRITGGRKHDSPTANSFQLQKNKTYVFDRAYCDLTFWMNITKAGSHFVTRLKDVSVPKIPEIQSSLRTNRCGLLYDGIYLPGHRSFSRRQIPTAERPGIRYRLIIYRDPVTQKTLYFVTSDFDRKALEIAKIYKRRWAVELCFRWFKGNLDIRRIASKTVNSIKIQLAIAVLIQLLLQLKKIASQYSGTLSELLYRIRAHLAFKSLTEEGAPPGCRWKPHIEASLGGIKL
jgi:hypothetical protein